MTSTALPSESPALPPGRDVPLPPAPGAAKGVRLHVYEAGEPRPERPSVVLLHGFPELAYSWRWQIPALVEAGFHVLVPDQRGYGESDAPPAIEDYGIEQLAGDQASLLEALGLERAVFVGHDWGGFVAWAMPLLHPERTAAVVGVNTPYIRFVPMTVLRSMVQRDEQLYVLWFQEPGVAEAVLDRQTRLVFEKLMRAASRPSGALFSKESAQGERSDANPFRRLETLKTGRPLLTPADIDFYTKGFSRTGFAGPIHWYRNIDANAKRLPGLGVTPLALPCLMVTAEWDAALPPKLAESMPERCSDLEMHLIEGCGHWTQQEKPQELNRILVDWLTRRFSAG